MQVELLKTLRQTLIKAKDLSQVLAYFFDNFGDHQEFLELGERCQDPILEEVLRVTAGQICRTPARIENLLLIRLADYTFVHGGFTIAGQVGTFFYFEDVRTGLASVYDARSGETRMARFTSSEPKLGFPAPSRN